MLTHLFLIIFYRTIGHFNDLPLVVFATTKVKDFLIKFNELNFPLTPIFDQFFNFNFGRLHQLHEGLIIYDFLMLLIEYILGCKQYTMD